MPNHSAPSLAITHDPRLTVTAAGSWQVHALAASGAIPALRAQLRRLPGNKEAAWDLTGVAGFDHIGAQFLWNAWNGTRPRQLALTPAQEQVLRRVETAAALVLPQRTSTPWYSPAALNRRLHEIGSHLSSFVALIGQLALDLARLAARPQRGPWREISASVYHIGYQALGITALVGFLIGVVLSYLSAQQLHIFGGDIYLVNILGMSVIRELGPLLAAILVAGRSGSAITAQLGVMRVTEELDAMLVMNMPHGFRLIMPRVLALALAMPLLVVWTDAVALLGGIAAAMLQLDLAPSYFLHQLPNAVPIANYAIGLGKGVVFGSLIALVACHFGLRIEPDTESLGAGTTLSVVTAITSVIVADAVFAIIFKGVGFY